jgi:hypothetical protein
MTDDSVELPGEEESEETQEDSSREITTTQDELEGYVIVKTILREAVDPDMVHMRDTLSYCGVLYDDNNRKPLCRLRFNRTQKYIGIINENKQEERFPIDRLHDIYNYADKLKTIALYYANG